MQAIIFALISYFTWGIGILIEAIVARRMKPYSLALWGFVFSSLALSFYAPFVINDLAGITFGLLILIVVNGIIVLFFGSITYYEALRISNRALVGTIGSSFPAVTVVFSVLFFHEKVSPQQVIAIIIIFTGLILSGFNIQEIRKKNIFSDKGVLLAFISMLSWGTWLALLKIPVREIGWFWPNYITFLLFPILFLYIKIRKIPIQRPTINHAFIPLVFSTALVRIAEFSYNLGISNGLVTIVAPIAGANPTLFVILAFIFFKDPISRQQIIGIVTTLIGIALLSFLSI